MPEVFRSAVLDAFAETVRVDPDRARAALLAALANGPIVEPTDDPGRSLVTFVVTDRTEQPFVMCEVFGQLEATIGLNPLPGADDIWWISVLAPPATATVYRYLERALALPPDGPLADSEAIEEYLRDRYRLTFVDGHNPHRRPPASFMPDLEPDGIPDPSRYDGLLVLPDVPRYRWHDPVDRRGALRERRFHSRAFDNDRTLTLWVPPDRPGAPDADLPVVVLFDSEIYLDPTFDAPAIFDHLVAHDLVPPFLAVLVGNVTESSRAWELPCHPGMVELIADELIPLLRAEFPLTADPARTLIGGISYGGLAALWVALNRPDVCGAVAASSPSLWWGKHPGLGRTDDLSLGRDESPQWLTRQYAAAPVTPVRFWLDVGSLETASLPMGDGVSQRLSVRTFREMLVDTGRDLIGYHEVDGGHDIESWRRTLPLPLIALLGG